MSILSIIEISRILKQNVNLKAVFLERMVVWVLFIASHEILSSKEVIKCR